VRDWLVGTKEVSGQGGWFETKQKEVGVRSESLPLQGRPVSANGMARPRPAPNLLECGWGGVTQSFKEHAMRTSQKTPGTIITIGLDLGKNTFHLMACGSLPPA
jgi:hypothetical protein